MFFSNMHVLFLVGDVIIEVENVTVEDEHHQIIVESLKNAGLSIRFVFQTWWSSVGSILQ